MASDRTAARRLQLQPAVVRAAHRQLLRRHPPRSAAQGRIPGDAVDLLRYVGEYATNFQDELRDDSRTNLPLVLVASDGFAPMGPVRQRSFRSDWLFSYQPTPGTVLFAGYGNTLATDDATVHRTMQRTRDGLFVKYSYLIRM